MLSHRGGSVSSGFPRAATGEVCGGSDGMVWFRGSVEQDEQWLCAPYPTDAHEEEGRDLGVSSLFYREIQQKH